MIRELDTVVLVRDLPEWGLRAGDVGAVVYAAPDGRHFEVENAAGAGRTVAVVTLEEVGVRVMGDVRKDAFRPG